MTEMTDLDARLRAYYDSLLTTFSSDAPPLAGAASARPRKMRYAWPLGLAAALAVTVSILGFRLLHGGSSAATVTLQLPGFTIVAAADTTVTPRMTRDQAIAVAFSSLAQHPITSADGSALTGFQVTTAVFEGNVLKVWHQCGAHWFLNSPENLWVIDMRAPPQSGVAYVQASVLVDDATGKPRYSDALTGPSGPSGC
jgi:hypothetical protein